MGRRTGPGHIVESISSMVRCSEVYLPEQLGSHHQRCGGGPNLEDGSAAVWSVSWSKTRRLEALDVLHNGVDFARQVSEQQ